MSAKRGNNAAKSIERTRLVRIVDETKGALAEMGFAKLHNLYYNPGLNNFHAIPDVDGVEIRSIADMSHSLIIRTWEPLDRDYVLLYVDGTIVSEIGWLPGSEAKERGQWKRPGGTAGAWFVPISALNSPETLVIHVAPLPDVD